MGQTAIGKKSFVIILDSRLILFGVVVCIAALVVSICEIRTEPNRFIVILDGPIDLSELGIGGTSAKIRFGRFRCGLDRFIIGGDGFLELPTAVKFNAFVEGVLGFAGKEQVCCSDRDGDRDPQYS